ncbi:response regulator, partial [bacterium]|nr:response regulator [bacterium]
MAKILIVDDEPSIRLTFRAFLEDDGHEVRVAEGVDDALTALEQEPADAVVTDIILERSSGIELLKIIQERWPETKVLLITGEPNVTTAANAVRLGAFDYLSKPLDGRMIRKSIVAALRMQDVERENAELRERLADSGAVADASSPLPAPTALDRLPALLVTARHTQDGWRLDTPPLGNLAAESTSGSAATWEETVTALIDPPHRNGFEKALILAAEAGGAIHWEGRGAVDAEGEHRRLCATGFVEGPENNLRADVLLMDVTDSRRHHAQRLIDQRMRAVATMAKGVARQVGAPLRYLSGHLELLAEMATEADHPEGPEALRELIGEAAQSLEAAIEAADRLAPFSPSDKATAVPVDVHPALDAAIAMVEPELHSKARLVRIFRDAPPILADPARL